MSVLGIQQYLSSAYHPQSQGALEWFHQTLKATLNKFCSESGRDWDEGVPLMLFAIRESTQETLGYNPFKLVYGHEVRGPLALLKESWFNDEIKVPLTVYVDRFKARLQLVGKIARENLAKGQMKMKNEFDKRCESRELKPGDKVLLFTPLLRNPLQSKYEGPFAVLKKESDLNYVISTPGKRKSKCLVHVNRLKPYFERCENESESPETIMCVLSTSEDSIKDFEDSNKGSDNNNKDFEIDIPTKLNNSDILANPFVKLIHLSSSQAHEVKELLLEFQQLFQDVPRPCTLVEHEVMLLPGVKPIKQAPYRVSPAKKKILESEVEYLLQHDLIEPSDSEWASLCVLVPKPDSTMRLCTDFRRVNDVCNAPAIPLPRIDDIIDSIGQAKYVTKLDLLKGYYQINLTKETRKITAFVTPTGLFQYKVLPFGLRSAPGTFQRAMNIVTSKLPGVEAYLDDLVVTSMTWEEHLERLRSLFQRLLEYNFTVNLPKSEFGKATLVFLGHTVGQGTLAPVSAKVEAIAKLPIPTDRKSVRRFLGMAGFYRRFCRNFAEVSVPLTDLVSPKKKFVWSPACQAAFDKIKLILSTEPVLKLPDFSKQFIIETDTSDVGLGAVLLQMGNDDVLHPICYHSSKLKSHQRGCATIEKEALSLLSALEKFEVYVDNTHIKVRVFTYHNPLQFVQKMRNKNQRLLRWSLALQKYNIELYHIKGKDNLVADTLSRNV